MQAVPDACPDQPGPAMALCFSKFSVAAEPLTRLIDGQTVTASHQWGAQAFPSMKRGENTGLGCVSAALARKGCPPGVEEALLGNTVSALLL